MRDKKKERNKEGKERAKQIKRKEIKKEKIWTMFTFALMSKRKCKSVKKRYAFETQR